MRRASSSNQRFWGGALCGLLFVALGWLFVNYPGLQEDESAFATPFFREWNFFAIQFGRVRVPLMQMSYVGSLKTWLYAPFIHLWTPGPALIRMPAVLIGAATIVLFGALLDRVHGRRAAWTGCVLLGTDSIFLLTTTFDWGPIALQHFLMTAAIFLVVLWSRNRSDMWLAAAAVLCGLAFWDKAVFVWMFSGLVFAGSLLFFRRVRKQLTARSLLFVAAAFCVGGIPLIVYNFQSVPKFVTVRSNSVLALDHFGDKFEMLHRTWNGSGLFGYITSDSADRPMAPRSPAEKASVLVHSVTGDRRTNASGLALLGGIVLIPFLWRTHVRDTLLFALVAGGVAWIFMIISGGGGSVHHAVLLWPLPHLFLAAAFAEASEHIRFGARALAATVVFLAAANLAVTNQYLFQFVRNGSAGVWSDAIYALAAGLRQTTASQAVLVDWGLEAPLAVLNRNSPPVKIIANPFANSAETETQRQADLQLLSDGKAIWVERTSGNEILAGVNKRLLDAARNAGFEQQRLNVYNDSHGRPFFQTFRFIARR